MANQAPRDPDELKRLREQGTITRTKQGTFTIYAVEGRNSTEFLHTVYEAVLASPSNAALELKRVDLLNSAIVGLLMSLTRQLRQAKKRFVLVRPSDRLRDLLTITATADELEIVDDLSTLEGGAPGPRPGPGR